MSYINHKRCVVRCVVRKDLADRREELPALMNGWPQSLLDDDGLCQRKFRCADLEEETDHGFNLVVWSPGEDFVDLANSIDWDFEEDKNNKMS